MATRKINISDFGMNAIGQGIKCALIKVAKPHKLQQKD